MNNKISFIRGDTKAYKFVRNDINNRPITWLPDEMYVTFKKDAYTDTNIWQKKLSTGDIKFDTSTNTYSFQIEASDTQELAYGNYVLDISYIKDKIVKTICTYDVELKKEVTFYTNM